MAKVIFGMVMSLDGFVTDREGSSGRLYEDFAGIVESEPVQQAIRETGAVVMGKRSYQGGDADYTGYEFQVPIFVITHTPEKPPKGENDKMKFTFVTDGVESAITQAKAAAGDKVVTVVGGANVGQQLLKAKLVDELHIDIAPVLLGDGLRLFENLENESIEIKQIDMQNSKHFTALKYQVVK
jgi:dihydrofolate reductase